MKRIIIAAFVLVIAGIVFAACGKDKTEPTTAPVVNVETTTAAEITTFAYENTSTGDEVEQPDFFYYKSLSALEKSFPEIVSTRVEREEPATGGAIEKYYDGNKKTAECSFDSEGRVVAKLFFVENGKTADYAVSYNYGGEKLQVSLIMNDADRLHMYTYTFYEDESIAGLANSYYDNNRKLISTDVYAFDRDGVCTSHQDKNDLQAMLLEQLAEKIGR